MSHNYPDGTGPNDPKAPWNQPEIKYVDCPDCDGFGWLDVDDGVDERGHSEPEEIMCKTCGGEGEIEDDGSDDEYQEEYF